MTLVSSAYNKDDPENNKKHVFLQVTVKSRRLFKLVEACKVIILKLDQVSMVLHT